MKNNANKSKESRKSSIEKIIFLRGSAIITAICVIIISNNTIGAKDNGNKPIDVKSSAAISSGISYKKNETVTFSTLVYTIDRVEHQKDVSNPLLGKDSEYIIIVIKVKNDGSKTEVFDAFDMILQASVKGENKNIRNISDTTIYNIPAGAEKDIKLVYIVPNNGTDIHIISEKNDKINLGVES